MTNEQINRAVAEELGWKPRMHPHDGLWSMGDNHDNIVGKNSHGGLSEDHCWKVCNLDFCNDYNAAAKMRKGIADSERYKFTANLIAVVMGPSRVMGAVNSVWPMLNATPRQQCEAFLRLRGKWREE